MAIKLVYPKKETGDAVFHRFSVDGKRFSREEGCAFTSKGRIHGTVSGERMLQAFCRKQFVDLPRLVTNWNFHLAVSCPSMQVVYELIRRTDAGQEESASIDIMFEAVDWRQPWSIKEYCDEFARVSKDILWDKCVHNATGMFSTLTLSVPFPELMMSLGAEFARRSFAIEEVHRETRIRLLARLNPESLVAFFNFPPAHAAAGKQYLVYFADFLRTLGLEADTAVSEEARKVLFTVSPTNGKEGLAAVQEALSIYLRLPAGQVSAVSRSDPDPNIRKLAATITHCQTLMAESTTPLIAATMHCATAGQLADKECFWGGRVALKKFEKGPLELDLPRIIRDLKTKFPLLKQLE